MDKKPNQFSSFIVKGGVRYGILSQEGTGENARRKIMATDSLGKGKGESVSEIFSEGKWISLSEYQSNRKILPDNNPKVVKKENNLKTAIKNVFSTFVSKKDAPISNDFYTERLTSLDDVTSMEGKDSPQIINSQFQNQIVRKMLKADKSKDTISLQKRNISKEISEKVEEIYFKDKSKSNEDLLEKDYYAILESGIEGAYLFARDFEKNKKENEDLCTNDRLDSFYKIDYVKIVRDNAGNIYSVYFIQIKTNRDDAENEKDKVFKKHEEYLKSLNVITKDEFIKQNLVEVEGKDYLNSKKFSRNNSEIKKNKNICFAKSFYSATYFVDRNTTDESKRISLIKEDKLLEGKDLTYIFK
ncbi:MAG: hypothetical protein WCO35_01880 [Candidatus Nomurabacteria bacterium]